MPAGGLRERKREKTHDALVASSLRQFSERGFDQVTVEEIAAECEVSPRTFFRYFASKEDVLFADADQKRDRLLDALSEQSGLLPPFRALESALRLIASDYTDQREELVLRHRIFTSTPSLRTRKAEHQQGWESELVEFLRASRPARRTSDLDLRLVVAATTTALRVAIEAWIADEGGRDLIKFLDTVFDRLRAGLDR